MYRGSGCGCLFMVGIEYWPHAKARQLAPKLAAFIQTYVPEGELLVVKNGQKDSKKANFLPVDFTQYTFIARLYLLIGAPFRHRQECPMQ